jgi:hypothetical protein
MRLDLIISEHLGDRYQVFNRQKPDRILFILR